MRLSFIHKIYTSIDFYLYAAITGGLELLIYMTYKPMVLATINGKLYKKRMYLAKLNAPDLSIYEDTPFIKHKGKVYLISNDIEENCNCVFCKKSVKAKPLNFDIAEMSYITQLAFTTKHYEKTSVAMDYAINKRM